MASPPDDHDPWCDDCRGYSHRDDCPSAPPDDHECDDACRAHHYLADHPDGPPDPASGEGRPPISTAGVLTVGPRQSAPDDHEAKAQEWIESAPIGRLGLAYPGTVHSLVALLRSVAEDARREERAEWVEACENAREKGRREEAAKWERAVREVMAIVRPTLDFHDEKPYATCKEILKRMKR